MKLYYLFLLLFGFNTLGFSQVVEECIVLNKSVSNGFAINSEIRLPQHITDFEPVTFNVFFWGFKRENNTGNIAFNEENIENAIEWLNLIYNECNISFNLLGFDTILSNEYYKLEHSSQFQPMLAEMYKNGHVSPNAFNVYVSNEYTGFGGIIENYYSTIIGIPSIQLLNSGTLEHEMGHCFNLLHTNDTRNINCESSIRDPNNQYYNADIAGDFVTDTAAGFIFAATDIDPDTCTLITIKKDCYGFPYNIPSSFLHNYMTISAHGCKKNQLTNGQFLRIRKAIVLDPYRSFENAKVK